MPHYSLKPVVNSGSLYPPRGDNGLCLNLAYTPSLGVHPYLYTSVLETYTYPTRHHCRLCERIVFVAYLQGIHLIVPQGWQPPCPNSLSEPAKERSASSDLLAGGTTKRTATTRRLDYTCHLDPRVSGLPGHSLQHCAMIFLRAANAQ